MTTAYNDGKFLLIWSIASIATFAVPVFIFGGARLANSDSAYEQQAQAAKYQQYNAENAAMAQYRNGAYDQEPREDEGCEWWQWGCDSAADRSSWQAQTNHAPWWWLWSEDDQRKEGVTAPTVIVIYVWHLVLLWALTIYGRRSVVGGGSLYGVSALCLMFANYSFISMLFLGGLEGAIFDDAAQLGANGWYGQTGVLLYMTNMLSVVFGLVYFFGFRRLAADKEITKVDVTPADYMSYDEPKVSTEGDAPETA